MMDPIVFDESIALDRRGEVGGKAAVLGHLVKHGFPVPKFFVVSAMVFSDFLKRGANAISLDADIDTLRSTILTKELPPELVSAVATALGSTAISGGIAHRRFAVRSSAVEEDSEGRSFAGQFETFLGLRTFAEISNAIRGCWASTVSDRVLAYRRVQDVRSLPSMAVIVQELVLASSAGVMFTSSPVTGAPDTMVIESNFGLGLSVVQGAVTPDNFVVDRHSWKIITRTVGAKRTMCVVEPNNTIRMVETPEELRQKLSLTDEEIVELSHFGTEIEHLLKRPQDIEWAIKDGKVYILQSRPITGVNQR